MGSGTFAASGILATYFSKTRHVIQNKGKNSAISQNELCTISLNTRPFIGGHQEHIFVR